MCAVATQERQRWAPAGWRGAAPLGAPGTKLALAPLRDGQRRAALR